MKIDVLNSPGLIPNAGALRNEIIKSVSYLEVMAGLLTPAKPTQAKTFDAFLVEVRTYIADLIDSTLPTFVSAAVNLASPRALVITFSEALDASVVPDVSAFVSSPAKTFSSVVVSGATVTLTATTDYVAGATTIAYTAPGTNGLRDGSANLVATFGAQSVTVA